MAEPHPWISILPGPLPCLYIWHACGRHAGTLTTPSTRHRLRVIRDITAEDEEAIILALEQRDRVRRIRLGIPVLKLQKLIMAIDGEYPILEYLILGDPPEDNSTVLILPETLETPHLRHLAIDCSIPIRFHYLRLLLASSHSILHYTTHPLTSSRLFCSSRFH
jgi:uncharacterized protein YbaR (Trm112 family)